MYATGHYGMALLVYAPVGHLLLKADPFLAFVGGAGVLALATLPDIDMDLPLVPHRGPTHSLLFLALVAGALGAVGWTIGQGPWQPLGGPTRAALFAGGIGVLGVGSHLLADMLTPAGVNLLWPLPAEALSFDVARADNTIANYGLLGLGAFATAAVVLVASPV
ncbi:metal-dependent hydrolase [Haloglomus litoreum]|uniref:metal-dependent hydrolase n=1 Tax=Haloglomus litoreum TaxID=3034026 RepID=UPI0023E8F579|nr:metal-dependent hydrolase [Haloglomus sp. DT116]